MVHWRQATSEHKTDEEASDKPLGDRDAELRRQVGMQAERYQELRRRPYARERVSSGGLEPGRG